MNRLSRIVFFLLIAGTAAVVVKGALAPPGPPLRVAFQVCNSLEENRERFEPLRAYLERKLGGPVRAIHVNTFDFVERAQGKEFDVVQANGYIYVNVKEKVGHMTGNEDMEAQGKIEKTKGKAHETVSKAKHNTKKAA